MQQTVRRQILYLYCLKFWADFHVQIYSHCWELMKNCGEIAAHHCHAASRWWFEHSQVMLTSYDHAQLYCICFESARIDIMVSLKDMSLNQQRQERQEFKGIGRCYLQLITCKKWAARKCHQICTSLPTSGDNLFRLQEICVRCMTFQSKLGVWCF